MRVSLPDLHQGRDKETQLYKLVNQLRRATNGSDGVDFFFYINDTTGALGISGSLIPSSSITANILGGVYYHPSAGTIFTRGEILANVKTNTMVGGETYNISVQGSTVGPTSLSLTLTSGSLGLQTASFNTNATSADEAYLFQISSNANVKTVEYSLVVRFYDR